MVPPAAPLLWRPPATRAGGVVAASRRRATAPQRAPAAMRARCLAAPRRRAKAPKQAGLERAGCRSTFPPGGWNAAE
eukprot:9629283-Alexandrium_andersonii.AAC.1